ncbi:MAG: hypothetical protein CL885_04035 [Dehalococcoidia bacterium]|nr:hypothetical protein [Dehalococcoidia bacterium]
MTMNVVGKKTPRIEGPEKTNGSLEYAADLKQSSYLWGKTLRSPYPHARIISIDTSQASKLEGVKVILTGKDHPHLMGRMMRDLPVLAIDKVRFIGERFFALAADSLDTVNQALELIHVQYEELEPAYTVDAALRHDAPLIHESPQSYPGAFSHPDQPELPNLCSYGRWTHGDVDKELRVSDRVISNTFYTQKEHHGYMETHACMVDVGTDGITNVWASNKSPHLLRMQLAATFEIEPTSVRVHPMPVGGDFGGKGSPMDVPVAYLLSKNAGKPVKIVMTYQEELLAANSRHPSKITVSTGVTSQGNLTSLQVDAVFDGGAYGAFKPAPNINLHGLEQAGSCYRFTALDVTSHIAYTNTLPSGHMRSPGGPQINFAIESHLNIVASELGIDAYQFRRKNLLRQGDLAPNEEKWGTIKAVEVLDAAAEKIGWGTPKGSHVGRGIAMYERGPIGGDSSCQIVVHTNGNITLFVPVADPGQGAYTAMQQIIAENLSISPNRIQVKAAPTDQLPFDLGVSGSRVTFALGATVMEGLKTIKNHLLELTGSEDFDQGYSALCDHFEGDAIIDAYKSVPIFPDPPSTEFTAQAAEVEVDVETGLVRVTKFISAHDVGTIINPEGHRGQILGGAIQGIGMALVEEHLIQDGKPITLSLADYKIPNIADIPEFEVVYLPRNEGPGPYNSGAIAEAANVPSASAVANAIQDAIKLPVCQLPVTAERIYSMTHQNNVEEEGNE